MSASHLRCFTPEEKKPFVLIDFEAGWAPEKVSTFWEQSLALLAMKSSLLSVVAHGYTN